MPRPHYSDTTADRSRYPVCAAVRECGTRRRPPPGGRLDLGEAGDSGGPSTADNASGPAHEPNTIRRQLGRAFLGVVVGATIVGIVTVLLIGSRLQAANAALDRTTSLDRQASILRAALLDQEVGFRGYELTGDRAFLSPYEQGRSAAQAAETAFLAAAGGDGYLRARLQDVSAAATDWQRSWVDHVVTLVQGGQLDEVRRQVETGQGEALFGVIRTRLDALDASINAPVDAVHADVESIQSFVAVVGIAALVATILVFAFLGGYLLVVVERPLVELVRTARKLEQGAPAAFRPHRDDEIGTLAQALERLHGELRGRYESAALEAARATALNELTEMLSLASDERALLAACSAVLQRVIATDGGDILLLTTTGDRLLRRMSWGEQGPETEVKAFDSASCPTIRTGRQLQSEDGRTPAALGCPVRDSRQRAHLCVPLAAMGRKIGVMHLIRNDPAAEFSRNDVQLATQIGNEAALVMANRRLVTELETMAMTDPLTAVRNARFFDGYFERELAAAERDNRPLGLIMLDVDHFKEFNDAYGHPAGDEALRTLAGTVESTIRSSDTVARYGGEEFIVAVRSADLEVTRAVAEKIRHAIETTAVQLSDGRRVPLSASLGVANTELHGHDRRILVLRADQALYRAKRLGRNRVELPTVRPEAGRSSSAGNRRS